MSNCCNTKETLVFVDAGGDRNINREAARQQRPRLSPSAPGASAAAADPGMLFNLLWAICSAS